MQENLVALTASLIGVLMLFFMAARIWNKTHNLLELVISSIISALSGSALVQIIRLIAEYAIKHPLVK